jgi:hypothetical protein
MVEGKYFRTFKKRTLRAKHTSASRGAVAAGVNPRFFAGIWERRSADRMP